jgi:hypothetical protein
MSTTEVEAKRAPAAIAQCHLCGQVGEQSAMTTDGQDFYCGQEAQDPAGMKAYVQVVADCTQRWMTAEAARAAAEYDQARAAHEAAEPAQETPAARDAETGPAEAPVQAQDAPEAGGNT